MVPLPGANQFVAPARNEVVSKELIDENEQNNTLPTGRQVCSL